MRCFPIATPEMPFVGIVEQLLQDRGLRRDGSTCQESEPYLTTGLASCRSRQSSALSSESMSLVLLYR